MTKTPDRLDHQIQIRMTTAERQEVQRIADERYEGRLTMVMRAALRLYLDREKRQEGRAA